VFASALAKVQQAGVIYRNVGDCGMVVAESGLRLAQMTSCIFVDDPAERASQANFWHWELAQKYFERLKTEESVRNDSFYSPTFELPRLPKLQRSIAIDFAYIFCPDWIDDSFLEELAKGFAFHLQRPRNREAARRSKRRALSDLPLESSESTSDRDEVVYRRAGSDGSLEGRLHLKHKRSKKENRENDVDKKVLRFFRLKTIYQPYNHGSLSIALPKQEKKIIKLEWR
jgi:hypothetical protein